MRAGFMNHLFPTGGFREVFHNEDFLWYYYQKQLQETRYLQHEAKFYKFSEKISLNSFYMVFQNKKRSILDL